MAGGQKETGELGQNHSGMRQQLMTQHKVPSIKRRIPSTGTSGKKFLDNSMNGPRRLKKNLTRGTEVVKAVPKEKVTY